MVDRTDVGVRVERVSLAHVHPGATLLVGTTGDDRRDERIAETLLTAGPVLWSRPAGRERMPRRHREVVVFDAGEHPSDAIAASYEPPRILHLDESVLDHPSLQHLMRAAPRAATAVLVDRCHPDVAPRCEAVLDDAEVAAWAAATAAPRPAPERRPGVVPPADDAQPGLTSIVIPVHGQWALTRRCIESIVEHTSRSIELVVVDDASPDDTAVRLGDLERSGALGGTALGGTALVVVATGANLGFPAAVNRGLVAASGELVCVLNNDTEVTPGWLDELVAVLDVPGTAMVGPRSNQISGLQCVAGAPALRARDDAHAWAREWSARRQGASWRIDRLVGFCLLARRRLFEELGGLDEGYGRGNFEDDELSDRVLAAGGALRVADGAVVLHHGSATFGALDLDYLTVLADAARHHHARRPRTVAPVATVVLAGDDDASTERTVSSVLGLGSRTRVVSDGEAEALALRLARTSRLGVEVVRAPWRTAAGAAASLEGLDAERVLLVSAGEIVEVTDWGAARAEIEAVVPGAVGVPVRGVPEIRLTATGPDAIEVIGGAADRTLEHLRVVGDPTASTGPVRPTTEHETDAPDPAAVGSTTGAPTPSGPLVAIVLADDASRDAVETTLATVAPLVEHFGATCVVLDRSGSATGDRDDAAWLSVDWTDADALAESLASIDAGQMLVLGAGERLLVDPAGIVHDRCLAGIDAVVGVPVGDAVEVRLAPCDHSAIGRIGSIEGEWTSRGLRIVPSDLEHADVIGVRYPELAAPSTVQAAFDGDPAWAERLDETMVIDEEARMLDQLRRERPVDFDADPASATVGVAIAYDPSPGVVDADGALHDTLTSLAGQSVRPVDVVVAVPPGTQLPAVDGIAPRLVEHHGLVAGEQALARAARLANLATTLVDGDWVAVVDAGDVLRPDHLEHLRAVAFADRSEMVHGLVAIASHDHVDVEPAAERPSGSAMGPLLLAGEHRVFALRPTAVEAGASPAANRTARLRTLGVAESVAEQVTVARPAGTARARRVPAGAAASVTTTTPAPSPPDGGVRLHLGCGPNLLDGWVNIDLEPDYGPDLVHDLSQGLPYPDGSVDLIHSEHFFEHLTLPEGLALMAECRRVLRPGGRLRIAMPDLRSTVLAYLGDWRDQEWVAAFPQLDTAAHMLNMGLREWGHRYVYDLQDLTLRLTSLGFVDVAPVPWGTSTEPALRGLETRADSLLVVEAVAPPA